MLRRRTNSRNTPKVRFRQTLARPSCRSPARARSHLAFREFLFVNLKRASSVQYISQELGMRRSGKLFGFVEALLRFGELLSLSVGDPLHYCFAHRDICGKKRSG